MLTERDHGSITIRNLDDALKSRLRVQAAVHGRSMEDEARDILRTVSIKSRGAKEPRHGDKRSVQAPWRF